MPIKSIRVSNFKSFKELELPLNHFNVLIGANAAGKSNFLQIF
ncbi:MAG: AAA family ATPase, partial [Chlorobiales bacterium]|nr:AAA family ATPase [Chlorobiales bacterium]